MGNIKLLDLLSYVHKSLRHLQWHPIMTKDTSQVFLQGNLQRGGFFSKKY